MRNMQRLARKYLEAIDRTAELRDEMVQLLRDTDAAHMFDETGRGLALQQIQRDLYTVILAKQLSERPGSVSGRSEDLIGEAELILDKERNPDMLDRPPPDMRTPDEERMYGALRVRWFELMKAAGIRPIPRGL